MKAVALYLARSRLSCTYFLRRRDFCWILGATYWKSSLVPSGRKVFVLKTVSLTSNKSPQFLSSSSDGPKKSDCDTGRRRIRGRRFRYGSDLVGRTLKPLR